MFIGSDYEGHLLIYAEECVFKQSLKNNMLFCILDSRVNSYPTPVCGTAFFLKTTVENAKVLELQMKNTGEH